jgi:hypothetical protein
MDKNKKDIETKLKEYEDRLADDNLSEEEAESILNDLDDDILKLEQELEQELKKLNNGIGQLPNRS